MAGEEAISDRIGSRVGYDYTRCSRPVTFVYFVCFVVSPLR